MTRRAIVLWTAVAAVIALFWANLPYLVGYANSTPTNHFGGFFLYEQDGYSYLAKMRQGAQGAWDFHLPYTSEDEYQTGGLALMFYIVIGKLAALGLDYQLIYHGSRLLSTLLLLVVLRRFISRFIADERWQVLTWWVLLFSSGWGLLFSTLLNPKYVAYELIAPDAYLFNILYGPPHVIFGFALLLIWITYTLDSFQTDRAQLPRRLLIANLVGGAAALSREAYGPVFAGLFAVYLMAFTAQHRRIPWREGVIVAASSLLAGAYGLYMLIAYRTIPGFVAWYRQNPFESPGLVDFALGFAPLLLLALIGRRALKALPARSERTFLIAWLLAAPVMTYLPIAISRRMIAGWQIPLGIIAAYGLLHLWRRRRLIAILIVTALVPSTLLVILGGSMRVLAQQPPLFITADQQTVLDWLGHNTTANDVVLSDWHFGNLIPTTADARVFIGHPIETIDYAEKSVAVDRFFDPTTPEADRQALIEQWHITLVVAPTDRSVRLNQTSAFQVGKYRIYLMRR